MRILVTGYLGYLGSVLVPMLLDAGYDVVGFDNELFKDCAYYPFEIDFPTFKRDVRDIQLADLHGFDAVVHLAGLSNDPLGDLNPKVTYEINYTAAVRLASLAKYAEVPRFVFSSSCAVYGSATARYVDENSALNPLTTFAQAKRRAEHDISRLADADFSPVFLRKPTMYGLSPYHRTDTALNNLVAWGATTGRIIVKSEGSAWRPYLHVEDVAQAFLLALDAPADDVHNEVFNVVKTEDNYQVRSLAALVAEVVPHARVEVVTEALHDARSYRVDGSKIARHLPQFQPRWTAEQGIAQLFEAYHDRLLTLDDFEGPRYKRVAYLKSLLSSGRVDEKLRWASQSARSGV